MPIVTVDTTSYPTLQTITNLARSYVRDDMQGATGAIGEGQILVDNMSVSITMANLFNSAVRELCRQLRMVNAPMLIVDNYVIANIPPMSGPQGVGVADPAVQVSIGQNGYFNGSSWAGAYRLPDGCFQVTRCWERMSDSGDVFHDMGEPADGIAGLYQTASFGRWEWRQDQVWLPGALESRDLRIRYVMTLQTQFVANVNPASTYLPIMDCEEAVAHKIARLYCYRQGNDLYPVAKVEEEKATAEFLNQFVQKQQGMDYQTKGYRNSSGFRIL